MPRKRLALIAGTCALIVVGGTVAAAMISSDDDPGQADMAPATPSASPDGGKAAAKSKDADKAPDLEKSTGLSEGSVAAAAKKASVDPVVVAKATTIIDATLDSLFAHLEKGKEPKIPNVGKALADEIEIAQYERQDAGWKITGAAKLDELEVIKVDDPKKPTAMTVRVCVDTSDVAIKNSSGRDMTTRTSTRSRSVFNMDLVDGEWRAKSRTLADPANCSA